MPSSRCELINTFAAFDDGDQNEDIPRHYWKSAGLIGRTPFVASQYDQRISYCLYVPEEHYQQEANRKLPLIVNVHGSTRRAERCRELTIPLADQTRAAVLAPLFPCGLNDPNERQDYKMLSFKGTRFDLILLSILDEVATRWPGIDTEKVFLFGFSGGGQFSLRFFYLHPERLSAVSIGAPGLSTRLDGQLLWPRGIKDVRDHFGGKTIDSDALKIPKVQLLVGEEDVDEVPIGSWHLMQKKAGNSGMNMPESLPNRKEAMLRLFDEFKQRDIQCSLDLIPGAAHDVAAVMPTVLRWLESEIGAHG